MRYFLCFFKISFVYALHRGEKVVFFQYVKYMSVIIHIKHFSWCWACIKYSMAVNSYYCCCGCCWRGIVVSTLCLLTHLIFSKSNNIDYTTIPILQNPCLIDEETEAQRDWFSWSHWATIHWVGIQTQVVCLKSPLLVTSLYYSQQQSHIWPHT